MKKEKNTEKFDLQFKNLIKGIIEEEGYFKEKNIKNLTKEIMETLDPVIAKHIKKHFKEIAMFIINQTSTEEKNAKTS